ncbi:MAG: hypothetical protein AB8B53_07350 [Flavobacteriales bacterium]
MTSIESVTGELKTTKYEVYQNLSDLNNLKDYLPEDKISNWESDGNECSFKVMGTYTIGLRIDESSTADHMKLVATDKSPFPFTLNLHLDEKAETLTEAHILCEAKLNPMLKMMVVKPLKNLFDFIITRAEKHYS